MAHPDGPANWQEAAIQAMARVDELKKCTALQEQLLEQMSAKVSDETGWQTAAILRQRMAHALIERDDARVERDEARETVVDLRRRIAMVLGVADHLLHEADDMREDPDRDEQWRTMDWCREMILRALNDPDARMLGRCNRCGEREELFGILCAECASDGAVPREECRRRIRDHNRQMRSL